MTFRIAAIGDIHLDASPTGRLAERVRVLEVFCDEIDEVGVDLVVVTGDLYERKSVPEERNAAIRWVRRVASRRPVVIVGGNHDAEGDLEVFGKLDTAHPVRVFERPGVVQIAGAAIACLPWPRKAHLLSRLPAPVAPAEGDAVAADLLRDVLRGLGAELAHAEGVKVLAAHAMVTGSITSTGQPLVGRGIEIGLEDLGLPGADVVLLGHVHKPQAWTFDGAPVVYTGSPSPTDWGETEEKSFVLVEKWAGEPLMWHRVPLPTTRLVHVTARHEPGGFVFAEGTPKGDDLAGAEVRFRYEVESDYREAARALAAAVAAQWHAAEVKIEEVVTPTVRARAPEITEAPTLEDKIRTLWKVRGTEPHPDRAARLFDKLAELAKDEPLAVSKAAPGRYDALRLRGIGPFEGEVAIDFASIPGTLVALTGPNGAGKSTLLEVLAGATTARRMCPTRGPLRGLATAKGAFVEATVVNGARHTIRHAFDGKGEALVLDENGRPRLEDVNVSAFDAWAKDHLPDPDVLFASTFGAQRGPRVGGGDPFLPVLEMKAGARKALLLRVLGIEKLEILAEAARARANTARAALDVLRARIAEASQGSVDLDALLVERARLEDDERAASKSATDAREALEAAKAAAALATEQRAKATERNAERSGLERQIGAAEQTIKDARVRLENNRAVVAEAAAIGDAIDGAATLDRRIAELALLIQDAASRADGLRRETLGCDRAIDAAVKRRRAAEARIATCKARLDGRAAIEAAKAAAPAHLEAVALAESAVAAAYTVVEAAEVEFAAAGRASLGVAERRIAGLRDGIEKAGEVRSPDDKDDVLNVTIEKDDETAREAAEAPARAKKAQAELRAAQDAVAKRQRELDAARAAKAKNDNAIAGESLLGQALSDLAEAERELEAAHLAETEARTRLEKVAAEVDALVKTQAVHQHEQRTLRETREKLEPQIKKRAVLEQAAARIEELERQIADAEERARTARIALAALGPVEALPEVSPTAPKEAAFERANARFHEVARAIARADEKIAAARTAAERVAGMRAEEDAHLEAVTDWGRLGEDLGKDGVQALEIDAAGPAWTTLANDLLHKAHGPRWSVRVDASRLTVDGKKTVEGCEISVLDTEAGREAAGESFSGGERVLLNEALSLALVMIGCRAARAHEPTIVRDETGAALDPDAAKAYVAMLRRAAELVGAPKVIFVSHAPEVVALADARVVVEGGKVEVRA